MLYVNGNWVTTEPSSRKIGFEQFEYFTFFNDQGMLKTILVLSYLEKDKTHLLARNYKPFIDRKIIKENMIKHWDQIEDFIKANDLNLKNKQDFLKVLDYYETLEETEGN